MEIFRHKKRNNDCSQSLVPFVMITGKIDKNRLDFSPYAAQCLQSDCQKRGNML